MTMKLAIVSDLDASARSHVATDEAIRHSASALGLAVESRWVGTAGLAVSDVAQELAKFNGIWIGPGSPYASMDGALNAIRYARERGIPLFGTCGGFQHIIIEYARNVLGYADAEHEESSPQASRLFISRLACSLAGRMMDITLAPDSMLARVYGRSGVREEYYCNFGVNPEYIPALTSGALKVAASDQEGTVRAVELAGHPFFVGTLFQPQLSSTAAQPHPVVSAFVKACARAPVA